MLFEHNNLFDIQHMCMLWLMMVFTLSWWLVGWSVLPCYTCIVDCFRALQQQVQSLKNFEFYFLFLKSMMHHGCIHTTIYVEEGIDSIIILVHTRRSTMLIHSRRIHSVIKAHIPRLIPLNLVGAILMVKPTKSWWWWYTTSSWIWIWVGGYCIDIIKDSMKFCFDDNYDKVNTRQDVC